MTSQTEQETVQCVACGETHPRSLSVVVTPSHLACGLACMTPAQRALFNLPDPEDAAIGAFPTPPHLQGWQDKPSKYFTLTMTETPADLPNLTQDHFRYAINQFGLAPTLRAGYANPQAKMDLTIEGTPITFLFSAYTAAGRLQVWIDATTQEEEPRLVAGARLSWTENPSRPELQHANGAAVRFLESTAPRDPYDDPPEHMGNKPNSRTTDLHPSPKEVSAHRKYLAFCLTTIKEIPSGESWRDHRPLGIACAAAYTPDYDHPITWKSLTPSGYIDHSMTQEDIRKIVRNLESFVQEGYTILTWNGMASAFDILAEESGLPEECKNLALNHVDMAFHLHAQMGHSPDPASAVDAMNTKYMSPNLTQSGATATRTWSLRAHRDTMEFITKDTQALLDLAVTAELAGHIKWNAHSGKPGIMELPDGWLQAVTAMELPAPNASRMDNLVPRSELTGWLNR